MSMCANYRVADVWIEIYSGIVQFPATAWLLLSTHAIHCVSFSLSLSANVFK